MTSTARVAAYLAAVVLAAGCSGQTPVDPPMSVVRSLHLSTLPMSSESISHGVEPVSGVATYACAFGSAASLFQWTYNGHAFTGTVTGVAVVGDAPDAHVESKVTALSGTVTGDAVTLTVGSQPPAFGSITPTKLSLQYATDSGEILPFDCAATDPDGWNAIVSNLRRGVELDNSDTADAIADRNLHDHISQLQNDIASRGSRIADASRKLDSNTSLSHALDDVRSSLAEVQSAATEVLQRTICSYDDAIYAADNVGYGADSVSHYRDALDQYVDSLNFEAHSIRDDIAGILADVLALGKLGAEPRSDTDALIAVGDDAISRLDDTAGAARVTGDGLLSTARQLADQAEAHAQSLCG